MSIFRKRDRLNWGLGSAIMYNSSLGSIEEKIAAGADVNGTYKSDYSRKPMIMWAADRNRPDVVKLLLSKGADANAKYGQTALMTAVNRKNAEMVKHLVEAGARVNESDTYYEPALLTAARSGAADIVKLLVENGADINVRGKDGNTALHFAGAGGYANLAAYLIEKGADITLANANMNTPADVAEKEYPSLAAMIRAKGRAEPAPAPDPGWKMTASDEIAHVTMKEGIRYRITEIFNFSARTYVHIATNLETRAESQSLKSFSELDAAEHLEIARDQLILRGGSPGDGAPKKKLQAPAV